MNPSAPEQLSHLQLPLYARQQLSVGIGIPSTLVELEQRVVGIDAQDYEAAGHAHLCGIAEVFDHTHDLVVEFVRHARAYRQSGLEALEGVSP